MLMRSWQARIRRNIMHVAESTFVKDVCTPYIVPEIIQSALFAIPIELAKHMKKMLKKE
jgi:hypothetical protein